MSAFRISIIIGCGLRANGSHITIEERAKMLARAKSLCLDAFGGYTVTQTDGGWKDAGTVCEEPGILFTLIAQAHELTVFPLLAAALRDTFEQRCIVVTREPVEVEFI
jgi:hypothetical protein